MFSSWVNRSHGMRGRSTTQVKCYSHQIISRVQPVNTTHRFWCWPWSQGWGALVKSLFFCVSLSLRVLVRMSHQRKPTLKWVCCPSFKVEAYLMWVSQSCLTLWDPMDGSLPDSSVHGDSPGKDTWKWVAMPFSRGSSLPRDQTQVSCIAGIFFTVWVTREYT